MRGVGWADLTCDGLRHQGWHRTTPLILPNPFGNALPAADIDSTGAPCRRLDILQLHLWSFFDTDSLRAAVCEQVDGVDTSGDFAAARSCSQYPNPLLHIEGLEGGAVGLPLSAREAAAVKAVSHKAPFGKGSGTIVDETVRRTWEVNASMISFKNAAFQKWVNETILPWATCELGLNDVQSTHVKADLYKLLLYEPGAIFKPHKDSEKAPGMFGTLVVCLPSEHEGGTVVLSHADRVKHFDSSKTSMLQVSYAAWYADVTHSVQEVTKGHRLVLTCNLIITSPSLIQTAAQLTETDKELADIFKGWSQSDESIDVAHLEVLLDHQYTEDHLKLSAMKGRDHEVVSRFARVGAGLGFKICLATVEFMQSGACETVYENSRSKYGRYYDEDEDDNDGSHSIIEEYDRSLKLKHVVDLNGKKLGGNISIEEENFIYDDPFADEEPDEEDYTGFTGNEGTTNTLWYRKTIMVICPKDNFLQFIAGPVISGESPAEPLVERLHSQILAGNSSLRTILSSVCSSVMSRVGTSGLSMRHMYASQDKKKDCLSVAAALITLNEDRSPDLFGEALFSVGHDHLSPQQFARLGKLFRDSQHFERFKLGLGRGLTTYTTLSKTLQAIGKLESTLSENNTLKSDCRSWAVSFIGKRLSEPWCKSYDDAIAVLDAIVSYGREFFFDTICPAVKRPTSFSAFEITFLANLPEKKSSLVGTEADEKWEQWYNDLTDYALGHFDLASLGALEAETTSYSYYTTTRSTTEDTGTMKIVDSVKGESLASLYFTLKERGQTEKANKLLAQVAQSMRKQGKLASKIYESSVFPFLAALKLRFEDTKLPVDPEVKGLFETAIRFYLLHYAQPRPEKPTELAMSPLDCRSYSCDCPVVSKFLQSGELTYRLSVNQKRRQHVHNALDRTFRSGQVSHETERNSVPHAMVIAKRPDQTYGNDTMNWKNRADRAQGRILSFGVPFLQSVLGDKFDELRFLRIVKEPAYIAQNRHLLDGEGGGGLRAGPSAGNATSTAGNSLLGNVKQYSWMTGTGAEPAAKKQRTDAGPTIIDLTRK